MGKAQSVMRSASLASTHMQLSGAEKARHRQLSCHFVVRVQYQVWVLTDTTKVVKVSLCVFRAPLMGQDFIALFIALDFLFIVTSLISTRMKY
jgi:hypothetical protein